MEVIHGFPALARLPRGSVALSGRVRSTTGEAFDWPVLTSTLTTSPGK